MTKTKPGQQKHDKQGKQDRVRPGWLDPTIVVALISLVGLIISALLPSPFLSTLIERIYPSTPILPSATPIPFVSIQSLDVIYEDHTVETINPNGEIKLTTGENVVFKVNIISNTNIDELVFVWEFCRSENDRAGQGIVDIPYIIGKEGQDCISIKIMKGGEFLETDYFFASIVPTDVRTPITIITPANATDTPKVTINPTQILQAVFDEIDNQFNMMKGNIAFNKPEQMKKDETTSVELILNPSLSKSTLATQIVERGGFVTSTVEPNVLIAPNGETVTIQTSQIEITPRMKAVLLPQDPEAFTVKEMHDNAEQIVSSVETTTWRWSVTAKMGGSQTLELIIYQLVKYDGKEFWHEVETYKADIVVEVTMTDWFKSLDWKWIAGAILIPLVGVAWGWWWNRNKKPDVLQVKILENKKDTKRKKKEK